MLSYHFSSGETSTYLQESGEASSCLLSCIQEMGGCPSNFDAFMLSFENHSTGTTGAVFCILMHEPHELFEVILSPVTSPVRLLKQLDYCLKWYAMRVDA